MLSELREIGADLRDVLVRAKPVVEKADKEGTTGKGVEGMIKFVAALVQ